MSIKLKIAIPNKKTWKKLEYNKTTFELKNENWKTSDSTKKKLKKYRNNPDKIIERFKKVHKKNMIILKLIILVLQNL